MNNFSDIIEQDANSTTGVMANLTYPASTVNVHLRPGYIVPRQDDTENVTSTSDLRTKDFNLYINRDTDGTAKGRLYLDKSDSQQALEWN
jgi:alpha-glucosidase (family GH31 glycosyl hydrolase)